MKIGIIGIGMLGEAVVLNLLNSGYDVAVYNRTKEKTIEIPDDLLAQHLSEQELIAFKFGSTGIFSVTVFAQKPGGTPIKSTEKEERILERSRCAPNSGCC